MAPTIGLKHGARPVCDCLQFQSPWGRTKGTCSRLHKHTEKSRGSLTSQNKACDMLGAAGWATRGPASEPQVLISQTVQLQTPLSPPWTSRKSLTRPSPAASVFSFYFCRRGAFLSIFPPCNAIQENKKALLTSALFSSYTQALSRLSIKPLPTQRRRQAYAHPSQRTIFPVPWDQHLQR